MNAMMPLRIVKMIASFSLSLLAACYVALNFANWPQAHGAIMLVLAQEGHAVYPQNLFPRFDSPTLATLLLAAICTLETLCALLGFAGVLRQWRARHATAAGYRDACGLSLVSAGIAMLVWFTIFTAIGGGLLQMWQSALGQASLASAFQFAVLALLTALLLVQPDVESR